MSKSTFKRVLFISLVLCSTLALAKNRVIPGGKGKILNYSQYETSSLKLVQDVYITSKSGRYSERQYVYNISNDGDFEVKRRNLRCRGCNYQVYFKILFPDFEKEDRQKDITMYDFKDELYAGRFINITLLVPGESEVPMKLKDGRALGEWLQSDDKPIENIRFNLSLVNPNGREVVKLKTLKILPVSDGKLRIARNVRGFSINKTDGVEKLSLKIDVQSTAYNESESRSYLNKTIADFDKQSKIDESLKESPLELGSIVTDFSGTYRYSQLGIDSTHENRANTWFVPFKYYNKPKNLELLSIGRFEISANATTEQAEISVAFNQLGNLEAFGNCNEFGKCEFELQTLFPGKIDLRYAKLKTTRAVDGMIDIKIEDSIGQLMAHYILSLKPMNSPYPRFDFFPNKYLP